MQKITNKFNFMKLIHNSLYLFYLEKQFFIVLPIENLEK